MSENVKNIQQIINFITKAMKNWKFELSRGGPILSEMKIQRGIIQRDSLLSQILAEEMIPLNYIFRKCIYIYKITQKKLIT